MSGPVYDAVVIGSGAGGGAVALGCCRRKWRVLVLEAGPAYDPVADYRLARSDWEQRDFPYKAGSQGRHSFAPLQVLDARWQHLYS